MTEPRDKRPEMRVEIDPEQLAKLIDGRLSPAERDRLLVQLDGNPELRATLADAAATIDELSADTKTKSSTIPIDGAQSRRRLFGPVTLALAAGLILAVGLPVFFRQSGGASIVSVEATIAALPMRAGGARPWQDRPWREFRGVGQPVSPRGRAVRIGALVVELEALAAAGDSGLSRTAAQAASLIDEYPGGSSVGDQYRSLAARDIANAEARRRALSNVALLADSPAFRLGAWLEAARIAAANGDSAFFAPASIEAAIRAAHDMAARDADAVRAIDALTATLAAPRPSWSLVTASLNAILAALAN